MTRYIKDATIGHMYEDANGTRFIYIGFGNVTTGCWHYNNCHFYLKESQILKYFDSIPTDIQLIMEELHKHIDFKFFYFNKHPKNFIKDLGKVVNVLPIFNVDNYYDFNLGITPSM